MQPKAKIYRPAKTAMSSGNAKTRHWVLEYKPAVKNSPEPLMGWASGGTLQQIHLRFSSKEEAIAYAEAKQIPYSIEEPKERQIAPKSYAANFATHRRTAF
jgi:hypothetical protein